MRFWAGPQILLIDLCRYRDYADIVAGGGVNALFWLGFLAGVAGEFVGIVSRPD